ncbi:hypothetical protein EV421DRAFT_1913393 [Armillaria borealis]|uniref:Uncharacterized protein n=1 Tax=Armillaria borealis TaxID=47425 RepID=A0AA39ITB2_9AGAR|nr:hypothetical protein EV421DRAFT_1913393 [Armillaria borealis]
MKLCIGLQTSGIVECFNTRHKLVENMGDLQVGEQYKNTDFVLAIALKDYKLKHTMVTYNIAC